MNSRSATAPRLPAHRGTPRTPRLQTIALRLIAVFAGAVVSIAAQSQTDISQSARALVEDLAAGKNHAVFETFGAEMRAALPEEQLSTVWRGLSTQLGTLHTIGAMRVTRQGGFDIALVQCSFDNAEIDAKVVFDESGKVSGLFFVPRREATQPAPVTRPSDISEREVTVGAEPWKLPGTLTIPEGSGPFPAVVLVHGSGPQDRDETIGPNTPFRDLAWGLAQRGIAVMRYEKRTKQYPEKISRMLPRLTLNEETVDDAGAAVDLLAEQPEIDPTRLVVLGHSLGGTAAPRIAAANAKVDGLVILAGATRPLEDAIVEQLRYLAELDGSISDQESAQIAQAEAARARIEDPDLTPDDVVTVLGTATPGAYWLDLRDYAPAKVAASLELPMLILHADRDYQVTQADLEVWQSALDGVDGVTIRRFQKLNHLFMKGEGPPSPADYETPGHVAPEVIDVIAQWINKCDRE